MARLFPERYALTPRNGLSSSSFLTPPLPGHQIVCHYVGKDYVCNDYFNPVDGDDVRFTTSSCVFTHSLTHSRTHYMNPAHAYPTHTGPRPALWPGADTRGFPFDGSASSLSGSRSAAVG